MDQEQNDRQHITLFAELKDHEKRITTAEAYIGFQKERHNNLHASHKELKVDHIDTTNTHNKRLGNLEAWVLRISVGALVLYFILKEFGVFEGIKTITHN